MRVVNSGTPKGRALVEKLVNRGSASMSAVDPVVRKIVQEVRRSGDAAVKKYATKWDGLAPRHSLHVAEEEMQSAWHTISAKSPDLCRALETAAGNIRKFCEWQKPNAWEKDLQPGVRVGQVICPLESVGCYVPGGRYPLPSTLLMTVIPAQIAGVRRISVASPNPAEATLAAAAMLGVKSFYRMGGAQAIAAFAYGTESVDRVDKIVGPGNVYVTAAKKLVSGLGDCSIDMLAGPTEIVVVSEKGNPAFIAAELVAQAEHDPATLAVFITASDDLAKAVAIEVKRQARGNKTAIASLSKNGAVILAGTHAESLELANQIASEHVTVEREDVGKITAAGSIFVGDYSAQSLGDYASGPNHVLPTGAAARFRGGLSVYDFVKIITVQEISAEGIRALAPTVVRLAEAEGLKAHAASVRVRVEKRAANA